MLLAPVPENTANLQLAHKLAEVVSVRGLDLELQGRLQGVKLLHQRGCPLLAMQSPLQPLHGLRSTLDLQHHRPGGCLCILYRALLLGLRLRLGLVLFLPVVFLDLGLLLLLGRLRFLWHRSLLDVLLLGELSLTRLAGAGLCILVVLDHFDARHREDHLGIALQAQVTLLHLLHGDRLEGHSIGCREFAASLGLEGLCLVGGAEITLGCDLSPLLFLSA